MSATTGTAWVGVQLSAELIRARRESGKTTSDIEISGLMSRQKLWRIENGIGPWKLADVTALSLLYGTPLEKRVLLEDMARASRNDVWSERYRESSPPRFGLYLSMEARATGLTVVNEELLHGLVQTTEYHRALLDAVPMADRAGDESQMRVRQQRQRAFWERADVRLSVILAESALSHRVGDEIVRRAQLGRLRELSERPGVSIRWIPASSPPHSAMRGPFTLLETADGTSAYTEHLDGGRILSHPETVGRFLGAARMAGEFSRDIKEYY